MKRLAAQVTIARRFQRSIRIDTDLNRPDALEGFVCPASSADVLTSMARHVSDTDHGAFTWTGPYGSGKSSLVVALCASLSGNRKVREAAAKALGDEASAALWPVFPPKSDGWHFVPVVGRRAPLSQLIGEALEAQGLVKKSAKPWTDTAVLQRLASLASEEPRRGGLLLIIDELGKALEGAAHDSHDIFILQQLAELASRSDHRFIIVGILHQAFDEYAQRLAREVRDEWAKVQGRFVDLVVNASGEEQLELLARAIEATGKRPPTSDSAAVVAALVRTGKQAGQKRAIELLGRCWPLHPAVAALLGPLSRRRFGQNQRSLFAFLNSAEPHAFQDFISDAAVTDLYTPDRLWDYLRVNLEPAILASPDGHRWSIGVDALERCSAANASDVEIRLLKTIILVDLFKERSGLLATADLLGCCISGASARDVEKALKALADRSCIVFRRHTGAYALFAGSDFDIDEALSAAMPPADAVNLAKLRDLAGLQPVLAKRHYHETGAIRWFNLDLVRLHDLASAVKEKPKAHGAAGRFLVVIPTQGENPTKAKKLCADVAGTSPPNLVVGISDHAWHVVQLTRELMALTNIHDERPELRGDPVARREVLARLNETQARLEQDLQKMADATLWFRSGVEPRRYSTSQLNALASDICAEQYAKAPQVLNELLNRDFPSSNAVKAQRDLMKRMLDGVGKERLGIEGWPAEAGLMESILLRTGLYREVEGEWKFVAPQTKADPAHLHPAWNAALKELRSRHKTAISLTEVYDLWSKPPYGLKEGLMPIFALALYIVHRDRLAVYRQGVFKSDMSELDVDLITSDPGHIQFRWIELSETAQEILSGVADLAVRLDPCSRAASGAPLDIARSLVAAYDQLPLWTKRTASLSPIAQKLASMLRYASDPNRLLFEDVPDLGDSKIGKAGKQVQTTVALLKTAFQELRLAYPNMLGELEKLMFAELEVRDGKPDSIRERAANLQQVTGDLRLKAFIQRLAHYKGTDADIEGIASLATEKKPGDWVDADIIQAKRQIAELAQDFKQHEEIARVAGRPDTRHRMSVIVPRDGAPRAMHTEFVVNAHDRDDVDELINKLDATLGRSSKHRRNIILAALAQLSSRYMEPLEAIVPPKRRAAR